MDSLVADIRRTLIEGAIIPRDMLNDALRVTHAKLTAKETKFFSFKGRVIQTVNVDDHAIQLEAADKILSVAGLYAREREESAGMPTVAIETSPNGVVRLIIGAAQRPMMGTGIDALTPLSTTPHQSEAMALVEASLAEPLVEVPRVTKPRRVPVPPQILRILHDEIVD